MNKEFSISRFLLPLSILFLIVGCFLLIAKMLGLNLFNSLSREFVVSVIWDCLVFGVLFFVTSLLDLHIMRKRNVENSQEMLIFGYESSLFVTLGWLCIFLVVGTLFLLFSVSMSG